MEILSISAEQTKELACILARKLKPKDVLALHGDLGSGKTTFTSFLVAALGIEKRVQSPTFVILRRYVRAINLEINSATTTKINAVNHLDLYRLQTAAEVVDIGISEILDESDAVTIIEWPELAKKLLPKERTIDIYFEQGKDELTRKITIQNLH
ncbi:tRNA (adenosine(37)-N6)-threonylcarbamoyltransferase complex ATPase subunit type 1 TsaE [candidate division WWE3 bacterium]|nr:tRNA (adenosine(37)-N6)-threonylcarbamoyltransferase complex ATPase subunit type 1 TsaE [candidate division WWE3 bacterium]